MLAPPSPATPHNVPAALSSFVGRAHEVAELCRALPASRLVTVTGAGGAGKTRLAREVAAALAASAGAPFPHGVWWVELAPATAGDDVAPTLAAALGVRPSPGNPIADALREALHGRRLLVVLDNCEHVVDAAAALAESLLRATPGLTVLATSRVPLAVEGEVARPVPPLARPPVDADAATVPVYEAVQLFVERARAASPGFAITPVNVRAVATICARLDGLPLALELGAATVAALGVDALAARLDDALTLLSRGRRTVPRHRTLRAVLDWSYELLGDAERALLRRLSVFRGSFTLDAVEDVCAPPDGAADVVPALGRLVEHSLVEVREEMGEARYRLLETVRQYAGALLRRTADERELRTRHARWVARLAAEAEPLLFGPARGRTVERLRRDVDEIRAALAWATGPDGDPMTAVRIAGALGWFWFTGVPWEEARATLAAARHALDAQHVTDAARPVADRVAVGTFLYPVEGLAYFAGDADAMLVLCAREQALWATLADAPLTPAQRLARARGRTLSHQLTALAHGMHGEHACAVREMDASLAVARDAGDPWLLAVMTMRRALVHLTAGDHAAAAADYRAAEPALRAMEEWWFLSLTHEGMAANALATGDLADATRQARRSVQVLRDEPDAWFVSRGLDALAAVLVARDARLPHDAHVATAALLLGGAAGLRRRCGTAVIGVDRERHAATTSAVRARLGDAVFAAEHARGEALALDDVFALVDDDVRYADIAGVEAPAAAEPRATAPAAHTLGIDVLGLLAMTRDGVALGVGALPAGKVRELLLFLLVHERATKDEIGLALWPDASPAQVRNAFHVTLHHLRRLLGEPRWIAFERNAYRLDRAPAPGVALDADVDAVLAAASRLRHAARRRERLSDDALETARVALGRRRGDLAQGIATEDWIVAHQDRVRAEWRDGMDALARLYAAAGRHVDAAAACEALVAREPLRESAHRLLMEAHAASGEPARALAHYEALAERLAREVGTVPSRETRAVADAIRRAAR